MLTLGIQVCSTLWWYRTFDNRNIFPQKCSTSLQLL